jgi:ATP-dependent DNA ligase
VLDLSTAALCLKPMSTVLREIKRRVAAAKAAFIEPCLPTLSDRPPSGPRWVHEIKDDGYRLQARRDAAGTYLITRNGFDWTDRYPAIAADLKALTCRSCVVDGEVVILDDVGALPVFDRLRHGKREKHEALLSAFDLLELKTAMISAGRRSIFARRSWIGCW